MVGAEWFYDDDRQSWTCGQAAFGSTPCTGQMAPNYPNQSIFVEVVKPERIVFSHGGGTPGKGGANFRATWTFEDEGGKTRVTMRPCSRRRRIATASFANTERSRAANRRYLDWPNTWPCNANFTINFLYLLWALTRGMK